MEITTTLRVFSSITLLACLLKGTNAVDSLRFFIVGDWGGLPTIPYTTYYERSTAFEMGKMAEAYGPKFIFALGDNFYYDGVKDVNDKRFNATYESVYTAESLQVPWYFVAGNHDHNGNVTAQIQYSAVSKRWNFPSYYYYKEFEIGASGKTAGFVMIDTVLLCGNTDDFKDEQPQGPMYQAVADDQWAWIEKALSSSKADYLFAAGHFPIYSIAEHGPTKCLEEKLQPMLEKYSANGYLCGHDHNLQHLSVKSPTGQPMDYFVSGMANFIDASKAHANSVPDGSLKFHNADVKAKGGFLYAETTASNMTLTFIDANGNHLYQTGVLPRKH